MWTEQSGQKRGDVNRVGLVVGNGLDRIKMGRGVWSGIQTVHTGPGLKCGSASGCVEGWEWPVNQGQAG